MEPFFFSCSRATVRSLGHLVWATSDGTWTTPLPLDGKVKQITSGMPTLCPIGKKTPFKGTVENLQLEWVRRSEMDEGWNEPSPGVEVGWALECLLSPLVIYRNKEWISTHRTHRKAGKCDQERIYGFKRAITSNIQDDFIT